MKKNILIILAAGGLLTVAIVWNSSSNNSQITDTEPVIDFSFNDYEGREVSLSDFNEKVILVNSWAAWCPFCKKELEDFVKLQEDFKDEIVIIAINRAEPLEKAKGFTDSVNITDNLIFLLDPDDRFYAQIGGFGMPETIFLNQKRQIVIHKRGPMQMEEMQEKVKSIINNNQ